MQCAVEGIIRQRSVAGWSVAIDIDGVAAARVAADALRPTASMGKVLLLIEVARQVTEGRLDPNERLTPQEDDRVGDSGLWQHLSEPDLSVASLAVLVGSVSDNLATNVLLSRIGLEAVQQTSVRLGMPQTRMTDRIRDVRGSGDPAAPSLSRATDLARLMASLAAGDVVSTDVSAMVRSWLAMGTDLSMVGSALGLDPLAHMDGPLRLFNKTGTDVGVLADAGHIAGPSGVCDYAVLAQWEPGPAMTAVDGAGAAIRGAMRAVGALICARVG